MPASEESFINELTIREPDDWHLHVRDDEMMALITHFTARQFSRAIIMPNLRRNLYYEKTDTTT